MSYWQAQELQEQQQQTSQRAVRWICPYCGHEVADERTPHCGELHAEPMPEGYDEN